MLPIAVAGALQLMMAAVALISVALTFASGSNPLTNLFAPQPDGYLAVFASEVDYFQWTADTNQALTGTWQSSYIYTRGNVQSNVESIRGTLDGTTISMSAYYLGRSFIGSVHGDVLTLSDFDADGCQVNADGCLTNAVFHRASINTYNTEVDALRKRAATGQRLYVASRQCNSS